MSSTTPTFTEACPVYSPFFSAMGAASAIVFACFGAAYGTAKAAGGIVSTAVMRPEAIFKLILPIIMAGVIGIYGLVVAVLVSNKGLESPGVPLSPFETPQLITSRIIPVEAVMSLRDSFMHLASGLSVGLSGLVAGFSIGIVGDAGSRALAQQPRLFIGTMLILVFAEVLGLYGLIIGVIFAAKEASPC